MFTSRFFLGVVCVWFVKASVTKNYEHWKQNILYCGIFRGGGAALTAIPQNEFDGNSLNVLSNMLIKYMLIRYRLWLINRWLCYAACDKHYSCILVVVV